MSSGCGRLDHVLWLGGSAGAGKTAVARTLTARYDLQLYSLDAAFEGHLLRAEPRLRRFLDLARRPASQLFEPPAADQMADLWDFYADEMELTARDLEAISVPVLAEGAGWLPSRICDLGGLDRALWLVSTPAWRRRIYRGDDRRDTRRLLDAYADPAAAFERWMCRDDLFAEHLLAEARRLGAHVVEVDGSRDVAATGARVAAQLGLDVRSSPD